MGNPVGKSQSWTFGIVRDKAELQMVRMIGQLLIDWPEYVNWLRLDMDASLDVNEWGVVRMKPDLMPGGRREETPGEPGWEEVYERTKAIAKRGNQAMLALHMHGPEQEHLRWEAWEVQARAELIAEKRVAAQGKA